MVTLALPMGYASLVQSSVCTLVRPLIEERVQIGQCRVQNNAAQHPFDETLGNVFLKTSTEVGAQQPTRPE